MKGILVAVLLGAAFVGLSLLPADGSRAQPFAKSIVVLKLDDETDGPLPGWEIALYEGAECQGPPIGEAVTDSSGMVDFFELEPAIYSVSESQQTGWEHLSPICQTVDLTDPPPPPGPCPITPDGTYPDAGCDVFDSGAAVKIDLSPIGQGVHRVAVNGPTQVARSQNPLDPHDGDSDSKRDFDTEIIHMNLQGTSPLGPITITESPSRDSTGLVEEETPGGDFFTADSFFDVFVEVQTPAGLLHNEQPIRLECKVNAMPPINCFYFPPISGPIPLLNAGGQLVGHILHAAHIPLPDHEVLVAFWNRRGQPTPTPTPPPLEFKSITVLKLNDETDEPLAGWEIALYGGADCQGQSISEVVTDSGGLVDFVGLPPAIYSVGEMLRTGWEAVSPTCETVDLTDPPPPPGPCPITPDLPYPDAGCDVFDSGAAVKIDLSPIGQGVHRVTLNGPTQVARSQNPLDPHDGDSDSKRDFDTEIIHLNLQGTSSLGLITITESPSRKSAGSVEEIIPGGNFFTADSHFDVFVEVETAAGLLHNEQPIRLECEVDAIPPVNCFYFPPIHERVPLLNAQGRLVGSILHAAHIPLPDREILVVFRNRPEVGATEEVPLQGGVCSPVTNTYPDGTPIATISGAIAPQGVLEALWQFEAGTWLGFSPDFPQVSNLTASNLLDVVFVCVGGSGPGVATFTRPVV